MNRQGISTAARALQLGVYRSLSTTAASRAAIATAASPSTSTSSETTPSPDTPSSSSAKRTSTRRMAIPASSARAGTAKSASSSASISGAAVKARNARVAPSKAVKVDVYADAGFGMDDAELEAMAAEDHTMQNFSGIDDYAHLAPPSQPRPVSAGTSAAARAPRRAVAPRPAPGSYQGDQPTPSPPMTSLPSGPSTLPMIGGHAGMPIPATLLAAESAGSDMARQPDISGEVSAPAGSDWTTSFYGLSQQPFSKEVAEALLKPLEPEDVELKPDGLLYLPEIKYRRTLNAAFGPGGWGLAPRGETNVGPRIVSREWGLVCLGRLVSVARGEQEYFDPSGIPTATEACKSNALMRCCKDLGIASELWDPRFIREYKAKYCEEVFTEHMAKKTKRKQWRKKGTKFEYPWKET